MTVVMDLAIKRILKQKLTLFVVFAIPLFLIIVPAPTEEMFSMRYGLFGLLLFFSAFLLSKQIIDDRSQKTVVRIAASPLSHKAYLAGHLMSYFLVIALQSIFFFLINLILASEGLTFNLIALSLYLFMGVLSLSFSLLWHTFFKSYATSMALFAVIVNIFALLGGLTVPVSMMPEPMQRVVVVIPAYWYSFGLEQAYLESYLNVVLSLLILLVFAIIFLTIGSKRRFE